jgi:Ala-tRNA(Pro) deacylase
MSMLAKLKLYLEENNVPYQVILHEEVYTAQELAQALHTPGRELVKVVVVKADEQYRMTVLSASKKIDLSKLRSLLKAATVSIVAEQELKALFPEAEIGAMPPFGNLYAMEVFVDKDLAGDEYITFNAGTHYEAVRMRYADYARLALPRVVPFTVHI